MTQDSGVVPTPDTELPAVKLVNVGLAAGDRLEARCRFGAVV